MANTGDRPDPPAQRNRRLWLKAGLGVSAVILIGGGFAAFQAWLFLRDRLIPLVAENLSEVLGRPVKLGPLESLTLRGGRVGESSIPPTDTDSDEARVDAVEINIDLLDFLRTRVLRLDVKLINPDIFLEQTDDGEWINIQLKEAEEEGPIKIELEELLVENGTLTLAPAPPEDLQEERARLAEDANQPRTTREYPLPTRITIEQVNGDVAFSDRAQQVDFNMSGIPATGGNLSVRGSANTETEDINLAVMANGIAAPDVSALLRSPIILETGTVNANMEVRLRQDEPFAMFGTASFEGVLARLVQVPIPFSESSGRLRFDGQVIALENVRSNYGSIPARADGTVHLEDGYNIVAQTRNLPLNELLRTFEIESPVDVEGRLNADLKITGPIDEPFISGTASNAGIVTVDRVPLSQASTQFSITPELLRFDGIRATPQAGGNLTGNGTIALDTEQINFALQATNWNGDAIARLYGANTDNFTVGPIDANVRVQGRADNVQTQVQWQAPGATYPGQGNILIAGDVIRFEDTLFRVAGGDVRARGTATDGRWEAFVSGSGVRLNEFSPDLRGDFSGDLRLTGSLDSFSPGDIRAEGRVNFSEGLALLDRPLTAAIDWNGQQLNVREATGPGFFASGFVAARLDGPNAPAVGDFNFFVDLRDFDLRDVPNPQPDQFRVAGFADFRGRVTGNPESPNAFGSARLTDFVVNDVAFDRSLSGDVRFFTGQGVNVDLAGRSDRIALQLNGEYRPLSFFIQRGDAIAQGRGNGQQLVASLSNFPIQVLGIKPVEDLRILSGIASGQFNLDITDLENPLVAGTVAIDRPAIGYLFADSFQGRFSYGNGSGILEDGVLSRGDGRYLISARFDQLGTDPRYEGSIVAENGRIEDVLVALQWFEIEDVARGLQTPVYATASAVSTVALDMFGRSIIDQLRRYSEVVALVEQQAIARAALSPIPNLDTLKGPFAGSIEFRGSQSAGATANFNLRGDNWLWGEYSADAVIAEGTFENGQINLLPIALEGITYQGQLQPADRQSNIAFTGQLGGPEQSGQLRIENLPVALLRQFVPIPFDLEGNLNATANLSGTRQNPQIVGQSTVDDATLNTVPLEQAVAFFDYSNARINFSGRLNITEEEPLIATGSIPYQSPLTDPTIDPGEEITIQVRVQNDGLKLIDILSSQQVRWEGGTGQAAVNVRGTLQTPIIEGSLTFQDAQIGGESLPEPIRNAQGQVGFNGNYIVVRSITGEFSDGQVAAAGTIPIFNEDLALPQPASEQAPEAVPGETPIAESPPAAEGEPPANADAPAPLSPFGPLTIGLNGLRLTIDDLYTGSAEGRVVITGTALAPLIGGSVLLSNSRIDFPDGAPAPPDQTATEEALNAVTTPPRFNNFDVSLGQNVQVRGPNLIFVIDGGLRLNGTIADLRPEGTINLRDGRVNIYTAEFLTDRSYPSRVIFRPRDGLDPFLDVQLITSVLEVVRQPLIQSASSLSPSEIEENPIRDFGSFQTIRVTAKVQSQSSEAFDNIVLASSPRRSDGEIVSLLGGGFANELGEGNAGLAIASLAGTAVLTNVQNFISRTLGLADFRLYPTTVTEPETGTTDFGLVAELGVDITPSISVSALQVLSGISVPTQFNLRYRLSDEFLLRGTTNLSGDSRAILEFETRF